MAAVVTTLKRDTSEVTAIFECLGQLHAAGVSPDWPVLFDRPTGAVALPGFVWQRSRFWSEAVGQRALRLAEPDHPLLGFRRPERGWVWEADLQDRSDWGLGDHQVMGQARFPAAAFLEMLNAAHRQLAPSIAVRLTDVRFHRHVALSEGGVRLTTSADEQEGMIRIYGPADELLVEAQLATALPASPPTMALDDNVGLPRHLTGASYYAGLRRLGYDYGPAFSRIESICFGPTLSRALIGGAPVEGLDFPPAVLDAGLQSMLVSELTAHELDEANGRDRLPIAIREVRLLKPLTADDFPIRASYALLSARRRGNRRRPRHAKSLCDQGRGAARCRLARGQRPVCAFRR